MYITLISYVQVPVAYISSLVSTFLKHFVRLGFIKGKFSGFSW